MLYFYSLFVSISYFFINILGALHEMFPLFVVFFYYSFFSFMFFLALISELILFRCLLTAGFFALSV